MNLLPSTAKSLILDMDGVLWTDSAPIGNLPHVFARIKELNLAVALATNNSTRTIDQYVEKLLSFGVSMEPWQIVTSSLAVANMMSHQLPAGSPVFAIGEQGLTDALKAANFEVLSIENAERLKQSLSVSTSWSASTRCARPHCWCAPGNRFLPPTLTRLFPPRVGRSPVRARGFRSL